MSFKARGDKFKGIFFIFSALLLVLLTSTRFTLWPEMIVYPYLVNKGFYLYTDLINPYPPSLIFFLSHFSKLFNYSIMSYQLLTWGIVIFINSIIFFLTSKIFKNYYLSIASTIFFTFFSIPFGVNQLWFDLVQTPLILLSVYNFYLFIKDKKYHNLDSSTLFALAAFFIKQQVVWLIIFYMFVVWIIYRKQSLSLILKIKKTYVFLALTVAVHILAFIKFKTLPDFVFWVVYFPFFKASSAPGYVSLPTIKQSLILASMVFFYLPIISMRKKGQKIIFLCALTLSLFAYPRFDYFHLVPSLSVFSILTGKNIQVFLKSTVLVKSTTVIAALILLIYSAQFFRNNWVKEVRFFEPDILSAATFLSLSTEPSDGIYIQNGPDQLLALANRLPPKPWADEFPWYLEQSDYQEQITKSIKSSNVKYVIYKPYNKGEKYDLGVYKPILISKFLDDNFSNYFLLSPALWLKARNDLL